MAKSNEVATKEDQLPADADLMSQLAGATGEGFDGTTADDYAIPYLSIAQSNSPQLKSSNGKFIDGLKMGMLFDTVEGMMFENVRVIPCFRDRAMVEWVPRDSGGGFVARHDPASGILSQTTRNDKGRDILPNGNEIIDTYYLYVLVLGDDGINRAMVISFTRTSVKKYKNLMTRARNLRMDGPNGPFTPPLYSHVYTVGTVTETSRAGEEYFNWDVQGDPALVDSEQLAEAKALFDAVASGARGAADPEQEAGGEMGATDDAAF